MPCKTAELPWESPVADIYNGSKPASADKPRRTQVSCMDNKLLGFCDCSIALLVL
jgi:hypothetical protein